MIISTDIQACCFAKKLVVVKSHLSALYNYSQFVHLNREKGEEVADTIAMGTQERGDAAVVTRLGKRQA